MPVCDYWSSKGNQKIAADGSGGAFVVWIDNRNGNDDIYIHRLAPDGNRLWGAEGVPATTSSLTDANPRVISDGADGATVAWGGSSRIMAQRIDPAGNRLWTDEGVMLVDEGMYPGVPWNGRST
ncbi:MAG: hypothetical protein PHQ19_09100 [Candidatus Krumholzibacteria bacterium]|nr:hypothetical protein [Candidatus Krumholzibacteria bacterium]